MDSWYLGDRSFFSQYKNAFIINFHELKIAKYDSNKIAAAHKAEHNSKMQLLLLNNDILLSLSLPLRWQL